MDTFHKLPAFQLLSTKAQNRLRYCNIVTEEELRSFLMNPRSMKLTEGVGPKTMEEFKNFLKSIEETKVIKKKTTKKHVKTHKKN